MQAKFKNDVRSLASTIKSHDNPFFKKSLELYNISSRKVTSKRVVDMLLNIEKFGENQYQLFVKERLRLGKNLRDPIKLNKYSP